MLALVITAVVALLVYGTVQAALDTRDRLHASLEQRQTARSVTAMLQDALRNIRRSAGVGDTVFVVIQGEGPTGRPADRLRFLSGGGFPPLSNEADWMVMLDPTGQGLALSIAPIGVASPPRLIALLPRVTGLEVRLRAAGAGAAWSRGWSNPTVVPAGVSITFLADSGNVTPPLQIALPIGGTL
jgi:hypothetical protein